ncbi:hypothetical protein CFBP5507_06110 [Agrobacterium salinitolerans]|uniref:Uncharacterized protein n=1 Tax=Agrobacterium salinitolerans TaxID=1183413 RepID=A0A4Z1QWG5_9HYPH|nr:hypothetical protein [Agrobacterium salinitolerans]UYZ08573.1 hypothetical protein CFBP5507_06110 [Agrobacterium salinitolerans]
MSKLKGKDISDEVRMAKSYAIDPNDAWENYIDFKEYRSTGFEAVVVDGQAYFCGKYGLGGAIPLDLVELGDERA